MSKPQKEFKSGSVSASIWPRTADVNGRTATFYSIKIEKTYKDGDEWKHSNFFSVEDLPKVELVAREAFKYVGLRSREPKQENTEAV